MPSDLFQPLPKSAPRAHGRFIQAVARGLLRLGGWKIVGQFPDHARLLLIAAPHSSAWDGYWGLVIKVAIGLHISFMAKRETFWFPLGPLLRWLGGMPVNRSNANGVVDQCVEAFARESNFWLVLAPEGTRRHVERWRSGFWHIAKRAQVPLVPVYFHYPERIVGIGEIIPLTDDLDADLARIRAWYRPYQGKHRGV